MDKKFYDRKDELALLNEKYKQIDKGGVMIAFYGRRRVGKTELIKKFIKNVNTSQLYFYVGLSQREVIFNNLAEAIKEQTGDIIKINQVSDFFKYLIAKSKNQKFILVLDEFQRFLDVAPEFITSLQNYWDSELKNQKIMILIAGSSIGMMQKIMNSRAGALYGRAQKIKISPFRYCDFRLMFPELTEEEKVIRFGVFGGTPYYLEKTKNYKDTNEAINELILKKDSDLYEEPKTLLEYENVKIHTKYNSILQSISFGKEMLKDIQDFTKMPSTDLPPYINRLDNLLDLIKKNDPILGRERLGRYQIKDNFFRFWYKFVFPNQSALNLGNLKIVDEFIKGNLNSYIGRVFEDIVKELLILYNTKEIKGFKFDFTEIGSWWDKNGNEIDIVACNSKSDNYYLGEVKWTNKPMDVGIVDNILNKSKFLQKAGTYHFFFVSKSGFTKKALNLMDSMGALHLNLKELQAHFEQD